MGWGCFQVSAGAPTRVLWFHGLGTVSKLPPGVCQSWPCLKGAEMSRGQRKSEQRPPTSKSPWVLELALDTSDLTSVHRLTCARLLHAGAFYPVGQAGSLG